MLLFDQNLAPELVRQLADVYPGATHTSLVGQERADDGDVWSFAAEHNLVIVTKDADFSDMVTLRGTPPKVIWLRLGNCTTRQVEFVLRQHVQDVVHLIDTEAMRILIISRTVAGP